jgi:putative oxidoreductase
MDTGLLIARLIFGFAMAAHGAQKLFGWFGGYGIAGTGGFFESLGFRPGKLFALLAGLGETGSGLLLAAGLLGPIGPALMTMVMIVAMITVHWNNGFFATGGGIEVPFLYAVLGATLAFTGPGAYSLDNALGFQWLSAPQYALTAITIAIAAALGNLLARKTPAQATA